MRARVNDVSNCGDRAAEGLRLGNEASPSLPAFSLFEVVIVVAIISAVSAIAIPRYANSLSRQRVDGAARRIAADLAYARSQAQISSVPKTVSFDTSQNQYTIPGVASLDPSSGPYVVDVTVEPYFSVLDAAVLDDPTDASDSTTAVIFDGYGVPDSGGTVSVKAGGITKTVTLDPGTGMATVQ